MSYQVLARKWRPRIFKEMVGQEHVLKALINALDHNRLHHAYLFTGTRGVGKTTIARILAKCLNCDTGVTSEPCDTCPSCCEINEGRFVDLIEVDAASRTKVEDTRELLDNVQYAPTKGRYKVYLIDEVHMLSGHSFNALLKTLEEPPPHVKFLLATTDPQKLPVTILSRCLQFNLKNMTSERVVEHLEHILEQEKIPFEQSALWLLGRSADGSMRDALSLTDQAIAFGNGKVTEDDVGAMLGTIDQRHVHEIVQALSLSDAKQLLACVEKLAEQSPDYDDALASLINILHRIAIAQVLPEAVENTFGDRDEILHMAQTIAGEDVQLFYQTALSGRRDLHLTPDLRGGFEMILLRMIAFKPQGLVELPTESFLKKISEGQSDNAVNSASPSLSNESEADASVKKPEAAATAAPVSTTSPTSTTASGPSEKKAVHSLLKNESSSNEDNVQVANEKSASEKNNVEEQKPKSKPQTRLHSKPQPQENNSAASSIDQQSVVPVKENLPSQQGNGASRSVKSPIKKQKKNLKPFSLNQVKPSDWNDLATQLSIGGVIQNTVMNCQLIERDENTFNFTLDERNSTLYDTNHQQRLADILTEYFKNICVVNIRLGDVTEETPAMIAARLKEERQAEALVSLQNDPIVIDVINTFGATLKTESVQPIDPE